jgi:predicted DCC family thiol-disulfide oxidoreductase YuxK
VAIVYFDGQCNVCNAFIDFLIRRDHARALKYAPLQGTTAAKRLPPGLNSDLTTMVYEVDGRIFTESTAALETLAALGGGYRLAKVFLLVPRFLRDGVYRFVAHHRYLFAGRRETCRLPTPEERAQFLD